MSSYYNPNRKRNLYDPNSPELFRLSRGKIDNFINCPRCFYLDRRLGVGQPPSYPFSLNSAVDKLLKKEFDVHRVNGSKHPLCDKYGSHLLTKRWMNGVTHYEEELQFTLTAQMHTRTPPERWNSFAT